MEGFLPVPIEPLLRYYQLLFLSFCLISACVTVIRRFTCVLDIFLPQTRSLNRRKAFLVVLHALARHKRRHFARHNGYISSCYKYLQSQNVGNPKSEAVKLESDLPKHDVPHGASADSSVADGIEATDLFHPLLTVKPLSHYDHPNWKRSARDNK